MDCGQGANLNIARSHRKCSVTEVLRLETPVGRGGQSYPSFALEDSGLQYLTKFLPFRKTSLQTRAALSQFAALALGFICVNESLQASFAGFDGAF